MSVRTHCDKCDAVIADGQGGRVIVFTGLTKREAKDLCPHHFATYLEAVKSWKAEK